MECKENRGLWMLLWELEEVNLKDEVEGLFVGCGDEDQLLGYWRICYWKLKELCIVGLSKRRVLW